MLTDCVAYRFMSLEIKKAICDILDGDSNVSMEHILAQLTAQFPDIPHPGFEGGTLQMYVEAQVEAYRKTHEQTSGGHPTAVEEHPTGDPLVNTEGLSGSEANVVVTSNSEPWESKVTDEKVTDGCVLQCLNRILRAYDREEASAANLRKYLTLIIEKAKREGTFESVFGEDNLLGDLHEDEAVVGQVRLLLKNKCGDGNYTFERISPDAINTTSDCLLIQGCLERVTEGPGWYHRDTKDKKDYNQVVTIDPAEISQDQDKDWMHTIVILPRGSDGSQRFWCHNLAADWGDEGVCMKHLGLKSNGQPLCGGYYLRFISRVYKIDIRERPSNDDDTSTKRARSTSSQPQPTNDEVCAICQESPVDIIRTACNHIFCRGHDDCPGLRRFAVCADPNADTIPCPICRRDIFGLLHQHFPSELATLNDIDNGASQEQRWVNWWQSVRAVHPHRVALRLLDEEFARAGLPSVRRQLRDRARREADQAIAQSDVEVARAARPRRFRLEPDPAQLRRQLRDQQDAEYAAAEAADRARREADQAIAQSDVEVARAARLRRFRPEPNPAPVVPA